MGGFPRFPADSEPWPRSGIERRSILVAADAGARRREAMMLLLLRCFRRGVTDTEEKEQMIRAAPDYVFLPFSPYQHHVCAFRQPTEADLQKRITKRFC